MSAPTVDPALVDKVRDALAQADNDGRPRPGRRALAHAFDTTEHQVRRVLADLSAHDLLPGVSDPAEDTRLATQETIPFPAVTADRALGVALPPAWQPSVTHAHPVAVPPPPAVPARVNAGEPRRQPRPWPLIVIGLAAAVAVWGGWVELGHLTGFGVVQPLPGLWDDLRVNTAIVLPLGIEAYGGYALRTWLSSARLSARTRSFARWSAIASLVIGAGAQVASHLMRAGGMTVAPPMVTVLVSCVPVLVMGLATGLATLVRRDASHEAGDR